MLYQFYHRIYNYETFLVHLVAIFIAEHHFVAICTCLGACVLQTIMPCLLPPCHAIMILINDCTSTHVFQEVWSIKVYRYSIVAWTHWYLAMATNHYLELITELSDYTTPLSISHLVSQATSICRIVSHSENNNTEQVQKATKNCRCK